MNFLESVRDYERRLPHEMAAKQAVKAAIDAGDVETLKVYAAQRFDSYCDLSFGSCGCAYCTARRAIQKATGGTTGPAESPQEKCRQDGCD